MAARLGLPAFVCVAFAMPVVGLANTVTISCQYVDDAGKPKKGWQPHVYTIDFDSQTVSHTADYLSGMDSKTLSYAAPAQITDKEIRWRARSTGGLPGDFKLDRYDWVLIEGGEHFVPMKFNCKKRIE